ncbi:hypothetical protein M0208_17180 [Sphingomonas sp. SUN019]|uniref:hypothetical protein n=1 Tax=Sphingomonas sp. SUN019 TaxID=2937788 RepID=UPI0021643B33|nr:hypothetical protein [Sphingomonas sp. SUN019]UVO52159.1 hypothetical protein M0208_17180 [Sphingomonas sp. SUN019]
MRRLRPVLMALGAVMALMGLLWIGQGLGYINWPASSYMLQQRVWADYGAALAVAGLLLILVARRIKR